MSTPIEIAEALFRLGHLAPETLGDIGVDLLEKGADTQAIRELAALDRSVTWRDVGDLFERVLEDLGRKPLTEREAAYVVAEAVAADIVAGRIAPYEGSARIGYWTWREAGMPDELTGFYYWADEWEDHPEYREACERDIVNEARAFLANRGARGT